MKAEKLFSLLLRVLQFLIMAPHNPAFLHGWFPPQLWKAGLSFLYFRDKSIRGCSQSQGTEVTCNIENLLVLGNLKLTSTDIISHRDLTTVPAPRAHVSICPQKHSFVIYTYFIFNVSSSFQRLWIKTKMSLHWLFFCDGFILAHGGLCVLETVSELSYPEHYPPTESSISPF